jgi:hypothetical protein
VVFPFLQQLISAAEMASFSPQRTGGSTQPLQPSPPPPLDYDEIFKLFTHRHTQTLYKRQAAAIRQIVREKKQGLSMSDLDPVCRVVQLGMKRLEESVAV